jgi:hypothetical protein
MGIAKAQMFCPEEKRLVLAERQTANHLLHVILSVLTVWLWLPVWLLLTIFSPRYRCPHCGSLAKAKWYPSDVVA